MQIFEVLKKVFKSSAKILLVFVVFAVITNIFLGSISSNKIHLQQNSLKTKREEIYGNINDPKYQETNSGKVAISLYQKMICASVGEGCTTEPTDSPENYDKSVFGMLGNAITFPFIYQPASGVSFVFDTLANSGFIPKTYAAKGIGYTGLMPFMNIWKIFRDFTFFILVIILVAIGFMIMFRMKIDPQTVISLENSLPRIVIALIFITFSFAIAGFLIDIMYLVVAVSISVLGTSFPDISIASQYKSDIFTSNGFFLFDKVFLDDRYAGVGTAIFSLLPDQIRGIITVVISHGTYVLILKFFPLIDHFVSAEMMSGASVAGTSLDGVIGLIWEAFWYFTLMGRFQAIAPLLLTVFMYLTALLIFFRLFFAIFKTYLNLFVLIIFSPIILIMESIPGKPMFKTWIKKILSHLSVFPVITIMLMLSERVMLIQPASGAIWQPPFLGAVQPEGFTVLLAVGVLFITPDVIKVVKKAISPEESPLATGLGLFFAGAGAGVGGGMALSQQIYSFGMGMSGFKMLRDFIKGGGGDKSRPSA